MPTIRKWAIVALLSAGMIIAYVDRANLSVALTVADGVAEGVAEGV